MWIIEHFSDYNGLQFLAAELKAQGKPVQFIDCTKDQEYKKCSEASVIFFGSQQLGQQLALEGKQGLYLGNDKFFASNISSCPQLLNPGKIISLKEVHEQLDNLWAEFPQGFFIRPNTWEKIFSGQVLSKDNFAKQWRNLTFYLDDLSPLVLISPLKKIEKEYRILWIKSQAVTASEYDLSSKEQKEVSGEPFKEFLNQIKLYVPDSCCTIDIALSEGELKLIEFNPLSTSAIYHCNVKQIIKALE